MTALQCITRRAIAWGRYLPPFALAGCLWLLADRLQGIDGAAMQAALAAPGPLTWAAALLAGGISFWAVARFELTTRRILGLSGPRRRAMRAGAAAVAVAQTVGFGAVSGALARWRALPELGLGGATALSVAVSLGFMAALGLLAAAANLAAQGYRWPLLLSLGALVLALILRLRPTARLPGLGPWCGAALLGWTVLDTVAGAAVLNVLLPAGPDLSPLRFLAAYLIALTAGFLSQSPGGLGAFELSLIALLPQVPHEPLVAALIGYRLVYHLLPALVAIAVLWRPAAAVRVATLQPALGGTLAGALAQAPHGDWALAAGRDGQRIVLSASRDRGWLTAVAGRSLVAIGPPGGAATHHDLPDLARANGLVPLLYKCDARSAARARAAGWRVMPIAREALIVPAQWNIQRPACRALRRKLRAAAAAQLAITRGQGALPLTAMAQVAQDWTLRNRSERGFSTGRFDPDLLARASVFLAWQDGQLQGFVSFNRGQNDWALDLMRVRHGAPDGTMQALVTAAIAAARDDGVARLSLAALPAWPAWLPSGLARRISAPGLTQFKRGFGPAWVPRYLAAPGFGGLVQGLISVAIAVHWPPPRTGTKDTAPGAEDAHMRPPRPDHAEIRFETRRAACDGLSADQTPAPLTLSIAARPSQGHTHDQRPFPPA